MHPFRNQTPKHRENRKECKHYSSYKGTLRIDFNKRCGYCDDYHIDHKRYYVIDHFVPQNPDGFSHKIKPNYYYNLVYACTFCNGRKSNTWPTLDGNKHNDGGKGFIMPTKKTYGRLFERDKQGFIKLASNSQLGKYIWNKLNLGWSLHSLMWKFEKILKQESFLNTLYNKTKDKSVKQKISAIRDLRLDVIDSILKTLNEQ